MAIRLDSLRFWRKVGEVTQTKERLDSLSQSEQARVQAIQAYWDFYSGNHFRYVREQGERLVVMNYCGPIVDKSVSFLMGQPFQIQVPKKNAANTLDILNETWDVNKRDTFGVEMGQHGSISGDCYVKVTFDEKKGVVRLIVLNSQYVFPELDPHDYAKMTAVRIIYPLRNAEGKEQTFMERISPDEIREFIDGEEQVARRRPNISGEIPIVHIPNMPISGMFHGKSDLAELVPMNQELNEKLTDVSDIINYHAAPVTLIFGAIAQKLEKGAKKVWSGLPKDGRVENLELQSDLAASNAYIERIKKAMLEIGQTPEIALGSQQAISNTSGVALHVQYQPLIDKTRIKQMTYGQGIKEINRLILKTWEAKLGFRVPGEEPYASEVKFADPLPKDLLIERQIIAQDLGMGLLSRKQAMIQLGSTPAEAAAMLKEISGEQALQFQAEMAAAQVNSGFTNGPGAAGGA